MLIYVDESDKTSYIGFIITAAILCVIIIVIASVAVVIILLVRKKRKLAKRIRVLEIQKSDLSLRYILYIAKYVHMYVVRYSLVACFTQVCSKE